MSWSAQCRAPGTHTFSRWERRAQQSGQGTVSVYSSQNIGNFTSLRFKRGTGGAASTP
ncbi:MAG UNVERIFIED_CONTAM: hypothetical protein LVT10_23570 [Anaerolineae bacterium]